MSSISKHRFGFLLRATLLLLGTDIIFSTVAFAERCEPLPNNPYEKIFCDLKRSGRGATLPNIYQFRDNTALTQALLLKKPAERAGIKIEIPERNNDETLKRQEDLLISSPENQNAGPVPLKPAVTTIAVIYQAPVKPVAIEQPTIIEENKPIIVEQLISKHDVQSVETEPVVASGVVVEAVPAEIKPAQNISLMDCTLQQLVLQCAGNHYQLIGNKTNQQLSNNALSEEHKLALPVYQGSMDDSDALDAYLAKAYDRYLQGMIEIGLGASTMSYTKFVNLHRYIVEQHLDFVSRFETMYAFLKKDKMAIGVSTKLAIADGFTPETCSQLDNFIACDYQKNNYVFAKFVP